MTVRIFTSPHFIANCNEEQLASLKSKFINYKTNGVIDPSFGRDVPFEFPGFAYEAGLRHIHLKDAPSSKNWHLKKIQFHRTSDTALVYCEGYLNNNNYLLLGFLENAHATYRETEYLRRLSVMAEKFRTKY